MSPLTFLLDENVNPALMAAVAKHDSDVVVSRVGCSGMPPLGATDLDVLSFAEEKGMVLVSFDKKSLPRHVANHLLSGHHTCGVILVSSDWISCRTGGVGSTLIYRWASQSRDIRESLREIAKDLTLIGCNCEFIELRDAIVYIPLTV
jgi:hypothetical protein